MFITRKWITLDDFIRLHGTYLDNFIDLYATSKAKFVKHLGTRLNNSSRDKSPLHLIKRFYHSRDFIRRVFKTFWYKKYEFNCHCETSLHEFTSHPGIFTRWVYRHACVSGWTSNRLWPMDGQKYGWTKGRWTDWMIQERFPCTRISRQWVSLDEFIIHHGHSLDLLIRIYQSSRDFIILALTFPYTKCINHRGISLIHVYES